MLRRLLFIISIALLLFPVLSSAQDEDEFIFFMNKPANRETVITYSVSFAGMDTTGFMHSTWGTTWTQFDGKTRGSYMRLINSDTVTSILDLLPTRFDTVVFTGWLKINLPRKTGAIILSSGSGWAVSFHNNYGAGFEFGGPGIAGGLLLQTLDATDSLRKFIKLVVVNMGASGARIRYYSSTNGADSLKKDTTNSAWVLNNSSNSAHTLSWASLNQQNNISDTTQQTTATTNYAFVDMRDWAMRIYKSGVDSLFGPWKSTGAGQMIYDSSRIFTYNWDRGNWTATNPEQNFNVGLGMFGECIGEVEMNRRKDPVLWHESGYKLSCIEPIGAGIALFVDSTHREAYTNASGYMFWNGGGYYCVGGNHNIINFNSTDNGKTYARKIARYNLGSGIWSSFNDTDYPVNNVISVLQVNDSIMYCATIDSISTVARTYGVSQYNWNTSTFSSIDSSTNDGGKGLRLYKSGDAILLGGDFTALGPTTGFNRVAIQRGYGTEWRKLGTGASNIVWSFLVTPSGDTLIAGSFGDFNGVTVNSICKWNGTTAVALGLGLTDSAGNPGTVFDMEYYNGEVWAFGDFHVAGSTGVMNVAAWNGTSWRNVGNIYRTNPNFKGQITEAAVDEAHNFLVIVGTFNKIEYNGEIRTSWNNVLFDGTKYVAMPPIDQRCEGVLVIGDSYYIDGDETQAGGWDFYNGGSNACHKVNPTFTQN